MDDLIQEFIAETRETLEALSGEIVAWEAAPDDRARLDAIFRFVHTVKGSCGFLDLPRLMRLSHAAEDALSDVREGKRRPDRALVDAVLAVVDRIGELVEAIDIGVSLPDGGEDLLIAALAEGANEAPAAAPATAPAIAPAARAPQRSVRLNVDLLDRMMSGMSDMVLARNELARRLREADPDPALEAALARLSGSVADMRDTVTRTRMQKVETLFSPLPRVVRDTAAALGKTVTLAIDGGDVELDRGMIEVMRDPLVHLIRNAIDHGIESPVERRAAGKSPAGRLHIGARQSGNQIVIEIADDGRGIDTEALIRKLVTHDRRNESELRALSDRERCELIFAAGLSSRDTATEISGRGVGMDVVKAAIDQIGGRIALENVPGRGLRIVVQVPLTLSIVSTIIVRSSSHCFAIPRSAIQEIVAERGASTRIDRVGDAQVAAVRDRRLPVVDLCALIDEPGRMGDRMLVIVSIGAGDFAIAVDEVLDTEELVVRPAAPPVMAAGLYAGQTLPDTGQPMLLLDCSGVAQLAGLQFTDALQRSTDEEEAIQPAVRAVLFRDLDGERRVIPLTAVDRIERIAAATLRSVAGRLRLAIDGRIVSAIAIAPVPEGKVAMLRLTDGDVEVAYIIDDAIDIISLPDNFVPAAGPGPGAGVVLIDGEQVEQVDPLWLFAQHAVDVPSPESSRPVCLLADTGGWMGSFLRPMLEQAGYRTVDRIGPDERPVVILAQAGAAVAGSADVPVVRLRMAAGDTGDGSVYRYDRDQLLHAMRRAVGE